MRDWSLHLLDLMENSLRAEAKLIRLSIELFSDGVMDITLEDDGCGMAPELAMEAGLPFTTTRTTRKVGLGLPLAWQNAELTGGYLRLSSCPGKGTKVMIRVHSSHIDCLPLGDLAETMISLICMNPQSPDFAWDLCSPQGQEHFSTAGVRQVLGPEIPLNESDVRDYLKGLLREQCQTVFGGILL